MANGQMEFPIGFDLEQGMAKAEKDANVIIKRLQKTIDDKPLTIKTKFDSTDFMQFQDAFKYGLSNIKDAADSTFIDIYDQAKNLGKNGASIKEVTDQLKDLEKEWKKLPANAKFDDNGNLTQEAQRIVMIYNELTTSLDAYGQSLTQIAKKIRQAAEAESKASQKRAEALGKLRQVMGAQETSIKAITDKLKVYKERLNTLDVSSDKFTKTAAEIRRLSTELEKANAKVKELTGTAVQKHEQQRRAAQQLTAEYRQQTTYVERLIKRMAVYASAAALGQFLTKVREITAQFELQRVSLGAIIQDQQKANQLFSQIKSFALKSPLKIMDLVTYTKQVAAYRIETDKLFDTTKRLADVSVGLGVDMQRIVLAYGQVKAASYLRSAEIRQFTEAGIPLLELLAEKFTELEGHAVSTEEVMDKVSKRMVSFGMVEDIFKDMTDAGGLFYNMQEKQSETLYGMWAKLGDAASVMYEEIGNTGSVNAAMKDVIRLIQSAANHWAAFASVVETGTIGVIAYKAAVAGLIPYYKLSNKQVMNNIKAEKLRKAQTAEIVSIGRAQTREEKYAIATKKQLRAADYEQYITETKLSASKKLLLARQSANNTQLRIAILRTKLFTNAQIDAIAKMSKWSLRWEILKIKIKNATTAIGNFLKAYWPLAALTAVVDLFADWESAQDNIAAATKKVNEAYEDTNNQLKELNATYSELEKARKAALASGDEKEMAATLTGYKDALKSVIKMLDKFGLKNIIDLSVINTPEKAAEVLQKWGTKLAEVNNLSKKWGTSLAEVANAYEGNIMGWSIFGENLNEDMKDLTRSWTSITVNRDFMRDLKTMRTDMNFISSTDAEFYETISKAIGMDAKLAISEKKRNESEVQYQQRILKYYNEIRKATQNWEIGGTIGAKLNYKKIDDSEFRSDLAEVMHEVKKTIAAFDDEEPMTIRMAIDEQWAINNWEEWQKDLVIQELNKDRLKAGLELIPTLSSAGVGTVVEGLKAIVSSEFPSLFNENDLKSMVSIESVVDAIDAKLKTANETIKKTALLQNNVAGNGKSYLNTQKQIAQLFDEIKEIEDKRARYEELKKNEAQLTVEQTAELNGLELNLLDIDESVVKTKKAQIDALINANSLYDEQIRKQKESAEAERDIALAAKERVTQMGFGDLAKDVKNTFGGLMVDNLKQMQGGNYSSRFLISDDDLAKIHDVEELYSLWATNTKAIADEKKKMEGVGISEAAIAKDRLELDKKMADINSQIAGIDQQMAEEEWKAVNAELMSLEYEMVRATTQQKYEDAQRKINELLDMAENKDFTLLYYDKQRLKTMLQQSLVAQDAQNAIEENLKNLDKAEELYKQLGERYNFKLEDKTKKGGSGEDPWIILMKNRSAFMKDFQAGVENLNKSMQRNLALGQEQDIMIYRGQSLGIDVKTLDGTRKELTDWYDEAIAEVKKRIAKMGGKLWEGLGVQAILAKDTKSRMIKKYQELLQELFNAQTDFKTAKLQKDMEEKLKRLADEVSRSQAAKEFFGKVFEQTGDYDMSVRLTASVYNESGADLKKKMVEQITALFGDVDISSAIDTGTMDIDYKALRKLYNENLDNILENNRQAADRFIQDGEKASMNLIQQWLKDLQKAKTYSQQRIELAQETQRRIAEIQADKSLSADDKNKLITGYQNREAREAAKLQYNAFKDSPLYVQMFDDLDNTSKKVLITMRNRLKALGTELKDLDPTQLKEMQSRINEIDEQLVKRNPFSELVKGMKEWKKMKKSGDSAGSKSESEAEKELLDATEERIKKEKALNDVLKDEKASKDDIAKAQQEFDDALADEESKQKAVDNWKQVKDQIKKGAEEILTVMQSFSDIANGIADLSEYFGADEEDVQYWRDIADSIGKITSGIDGILQSAMSGNITGVISSAITAIPNLVMGFGDLFSGAAGKVKRANKEIKKQQKLLDQLEYAYSRLEVAIENAYGANYISDYNQQIDNLKAQQQAYLKQAEAEESKGKKKDKDKIEEYKQAAQEVADQIEDMKSQISEQMLGSSITSAAQEFAQAWLDAYKEFSNTTDAMKEKFQDMIENMIANNVIATVMEKSLQGVYDMINNMDESDFYNTSFWQKLAQEAQTASEAANNGATTLMKFLEAAGISVRDTTSDLTGISRDIATASEESINGLAAGINTQNYYISQIYAFVKMIAEGGAGSAVSGTETPTIADLVTIMNTHLAYLPSIAQNTLDTVERCERAATACEGIAKSVSRVISAKGSKAAYVINTQIV